MEKRLFIRSILVDTSQVLWRCVIELENCLTNISQNNGRKHDGGHAGYVPILLIFNLYLVAETSL